MSNVKQIKKVVESDDYEMSLSKLKAGNIIDEAAINLEVNTQETVREIEITRIAPSRFPTQKRRRERFFTKENIKVLADSIKTYGLRQPILVRPVAVLDDLKADFEIVFGERRFLALTANGARKIRCFVEELTDAQVLELQYEENHQRNENNPFDDAFLFKFLVDKEDYSVEKLANRFAVGKKEVTEKLRLNELIPEAVKEFDDGHLPLKHAYYLAKFPVEKQNIIVKEAYAYKYGDIDDGACSYQEFKEEVEENILRLLNDAPFDTQDERLHLHKLKCSECPERTGYSPLLFSDLKNNDSCLNKKCFDAKTNVHLHLQRESIAAQVATTSNKSIKEVITKVPIVTDRAWVGEGETPFKEKILTSQKFYEKPECEFSELSLIGAGEKKGQQTYICRNSDCSVHHPKTEVKPISNSALQTLEENFNEKVKQAVRQKVFTEAIEYFDDNKPFWMFDDLVCRLLSEMWWDTGTDTRKNIGEIIKKWKKCPKDLYDRAQVNDFILSLDKRQQTQLLFLLTFSTEGYFLNSSQDGVKKLAKDYTKLDYKLVDADIRLKLAPEEFKPLAEDYLNSVITGIATEIPNFWWKEKVEE